MTTLPLAAPCALSPADKQRQVKVVGEDLMKHHGKRRFYSTAQVRAANERCGIHIDYVCWSYAVFGTHYDFDRLHAGVGGACDYLAMKRDMLESVATDATSGWFDFDFDLSWIDFPDIDWSIFDVFD